MMNLLFLMSICSIQSFAEDAIKKISDKELQIDKLVPQSEVISKDAIIAKDKGIDDSIINLQNQINLLQQKKVESRALLQKANDLGLKTQAELNKP